MSKLLETDLVRERWQKTLAAEALDDADREDFMLGGLGARVQEPTARLVLLPPDPQAETPGLYDSIWDWLETRRTIRLGNGEVPLGDNVVPTAHAAALVRDGGENRAWRNYAAVHRSGAVEVGLGDRGAANRSTQNGDKTRFFWLISIVAYTWAMAELARDLPVDANREGPFLLTAALRNTQGALLDHRGEGWAPAQSPWNNLGRCPDKNLLWHIEFDHLPEDPSTSQALAFRVGDRIENAWGCRQRLYLDRQGELAGHFDVSRLHR